MIAFLAFLVFPQKSFAATYNVDIQPVSRNVNPGESVSYNVDVSSFGSGLMFFDIFNMSISGLPAGFSYSFSPNPIISMVHCVFGFVGGMSCFASGSSTLWITVPTDVSNRSYTFNVNVSGLSGGSSVQAFIFVNYIAPPTTNLTVTPDTIKQGQSVQLVWSATNATGCTAYSTQNIWSGDKPVSGSEEVAIAAAPPDIYIFTLTCRGAGSSSANAIVNVSHPKYKGVFIGENININTNRDYVLQIEYDSRIINIAPPGFAQIFAPLWKEIAP